ncbi:hypothetical protein C0Q70_00403 [Pomacea canaliculata]|uniref:Uncharacterized protein n=1 Tax=Pomacea canaliculata TaxID=400727 RepID=A0A2T7PWK0_POMCA|nr:hypothetical protein C0Q70_00403 [Pomacea canaliculata]
MFRGLMLLAFGVCKNEPADWLSFAGAVAHVPGKYGFSPKQEPLYDEASTSRESDEDSDEPGQPVQHAGLLKAMNPNPRVIVFLLHRLCTQPQLRNSFYFCWNMALDQV